jgi:adenosylcobinamide kinase/adenosylcobinamide-phosphate guanylyltransferase
MMTLVLGGARSGKSRFAQSLCRAGKRIAYVATARIEDEEMRARIERHRSERPANWLTIEEPLALADAITRAVPCADTLLIDCLTVWLSNLFLDRQEDSAFEQVERLAVLAQGRDVILVSNEVGSSIVPENELARRFRDLQGLLNQRCAALAARVYLTVAGIPIPIKGGA